MTFSGDDPARLRSRDIEPRTNGKHPGSKIDAPDSQGSSIPGNAPEIDLAEWPVLFDVHKVAIIGAGPSGLAAAKYLLAQGQDVFQQVDIFEQRGEVGGVWKHTPWITGATREAADSKVVDKVPLTDPFVEVDEPVFLYDEGAGRGNGKTETTAKDNKPEPIFPSPMYDELNTNIPHTLMQFSDKPFPKDCEIYPTRQIVQDYLVEYARDVRHLIRFATQVVDVSLVEEHALLSPSPATKDGPHIVREKWTVASRDLRTNKTTSAVYDAVVVASGHYATPYIPDVPGIREFHAAYPDVISHSKSYRNPSDPRYGCTPSGARKVVVVGNSASGLDIAAQIRRARAGAADGGTNGKRTASLISSVQSPTSDDMRRFIEEDQGFVYDEAAPIARFLVEEKGVEFQDGRIEYGVDRVLFATGFLYTFPFLKGLSLESGGHGKATGLGFGMDLVNGHPRPPSTTETPLITNGRRVHNLAKHFLHTVHPTIVFPGLPIKVIPFPLAEAQAAVFSRIWANLIPLPSQAVLQEWEREPAEAAERKYAAGERPGLSEEARWAKAERGYHVFETGGDGKYINELHSWVMRYEAAGKHEHSGVGGGGQAAQPPPPLTENKINSKGRSGKSPPFWDEELLWQRTIFAQARIAFERSGRTAKTLEELGFLFPGKSDGGVDAVAAAAAVAARRSLDRNGQSAGDVDGHGTGEREVVAGAEAFASI